MSRSSITLAAQQEQLPVLGRPAQILYPLDPR